MDKQIKGCLLIDEMCDYNYEVKLGEYVFTCRSLSIKDKRRIAKVMNTGINTEGTITMGYGDVVASNFETIICAVSDWNVPRPLTPETLQLLPQPVYDRLHQAIVDHERQINDALEAELKN